MMNPLQIASLFDRAVAFIIDWHIRVIPLAIWGFTIFILAYPPLFEQATHGNIDWSWWWQTEIIARLQQDFFVTSGWVSVVVYFIYHPLVEWLMRGNSPGKLSMELRVVDLSGHPPSTRQVMIRNLWRVIEFLPIAYAWGWYAMAQSPEHRRPGDVAAGTRVVAISRKRAS